MLLAALHSHEVRRWLRGTGSIRQTFANAGVGLVFAASQLMFRGFLLSAFATVAHLVPWKLPHTWWGYLAAFVLVDFLYYAQHRLEHAVPVLWAIHSVHHQSKDYNLSVSFRVGVFASFSTTFFHLLLALLGMSTEMYAGLLTVHAILLFGLHSRIRFTFGPGRFFNAPLFHRVHHGAEDEYIDKNFGGILLVFDRLLGTFAPYTKEPSYGTVGQTVDNNPITANAAPWDELRRNLRKQATIGSKLRALFVR
jgi:alkylglycerol monooxygenase